MNVACRLCGSSSTKIRHDSVAGYNIDGDFSILDCADCGVAFTYPFLSDQATRDYYDQQAIAFNGVGGTSLIDDYLADKEAYWHKLGYNARYGEIRRFHPGAKSILDIGSGAGIFLDLCRSRGMDVQGLELSQWGFNTANKSLELPTAKLTVADFASTAERIFDVVTMFDVLEHGSNPKNDLAAAKRLLAPGGILIINLPNIDSLVSKLTGPEWNKLIPPNHTYHFSSQSLQKLVGDSGFKTLLVKTNHGDSKELAYQLMLGIWRQAAKKNRAVARVYADRTEKISGKPPLAILMKGSIKISPSLWPLAAAAKPVISAAGTGEGLHLIARLES